MTDRTLVKGVADTYLFSSLLADYLQSLRERNYSPDSMRTRRHAIGYFVRFAYERGLTHPREVTLPVLNRYRKYLFDWRSYNVRDKGKPLSFRHQAELLLSVKIFFKWLTRERHILYNPATELEVPRVHDRLPKDILTAAEMELVINQPDVTKPLGIRNRAILETMYSTAIRRTELTKVTVHDLDPKRGMLRIRFAKYGIERVAPIGERALAWIDKYMRDVRSNLVAGDDIEQLFVSKLGYALSPKELAEIVAKSIKAANIGKGGGCHTIRHTAATVMLEAGADTRHIQEFLGHKHLASTQVYTRVSPTNLKAVHERFHPAAKLERVPSLEADGDGKS